MAANNWLKYATVPGACAAGVALWVGLGLPKVAWTTDIHRLDRNQAAMAVQIYSNRVNSLLSIQPPTDPVARQNWQEQLRQSQRDLEAAQQRSIQLSK